MRTIKKNAGNVKINNRKEGEKERGRRLKGTEKLRELDRFKKRRERKTGQDEIGSDHA